MSEHQSRTASDDLYDHEREEPRTSRRRRPVADWGVGEDMFEHMPRNRFSRAAEGPPRDRRFSRAAEADREGDEETVREDEPADDLAARREARARDWDDAAGWVETARDRGDAAGWEETARDRGDAARWEETARDRGDAARWEETARDDSQREAPEAPVRWTGPHRDGADEDEAPRRRAAAGPPEGVPRGRVQDGRRTIVIGKPEDVPSEIAAITADRDIGDEPAPELPAQGERRTVRIGGRPEGSLEAARFHRDRSSHRRPPRRAHERLGARPDRIAMWAFALGLLLIVIAILSAH